ncbi:Sporulation protein [Sphingopyxis granuli]|uniref:Sporulation protein n=2 Tax=Sphingopyxis granuli TaxID=267128 RepID=A0AA86GM04_9SPHN|nr:Sporulation protein [Sphingopyxis granuli]
MALQASQPDAATKAAMEKRTAARTLLSSAIPRIAANGSDPGALLDAGRASIDLEDYRAALGFLVRAEKANPRDGAVKAALGSTMVRMENPTRALDYFGEAQLLGAPERLFLADRGLARDLLGQQDAAQRDYQLALSLGPNEEVTRRYALSLGISGDPDRAVEMLTPQLRAQDRGAWRVRAMILAMNGRDKEATDIVNATMPPQLAQNILPYLTQLDRLNPAQQAAAAHFGRFPSGELGPRRKPVQMAAATPAPTPAPVSAPVDARRPASGQRSERGRASAAAPSPARRVPALATTSPDTRPQPRAAPPAASAASNPIPAERKPALSSTQQAPSPAPAQAVPSPTSNAAPIGVAVNHTSGPVGPGFSVGGSGAPSPSAAPALAAAPPPDPAAAVAKPTAAAPLASLAGIIGSIEIPPEELARPDNAIGADTLAMLQAEKRKAEAAEAAEAAKREKEEAATKAKAEADAKAKEEAAKKKANPARLWVQIATGANEKALAFDYNRFAKKNADLFKGKAGATAEWGRTRRLLVGPFASKKAAQDWLADYKKAGGDGFLFNSEAGETVDPVK